MASKWQRYENQTAYLFAGMQFHVDGLGPT